MTTSTTDLVSFLTQAREATNTVLGDWCDRIRDDLPEPVGEAVEYSLTAPGKRLRPALVLGVFRELGGTGDVSEIAAAVEVVHTYSLVHDDLPCMDDDDLRRGRSTTHRRFGVAVPVEAGVAMVPLAARVLAEGCERLGLAAETMGEIGMELFRAAGASGMIGGQVLDLEAEGRPVSLDDLREIHRHKTGALITASAVIGAMAAGATAPRVESVRAYGREIGVAFQIADDVLDATATSQELGKTAGKDARQHKATFATVLGTETAMEEAQDAVSRAMDHLGGGGIDSPLLGSLAKFVVDRRS